MSLRRDAVYTGGFSALRLAISVAAIPVMTRSLGLAVFGEWTVLMAVLGLVPIAQVGLGPALSYLISARPADRCAIVGSSLVLFLAIGAAVSIPLVFAAPMLAPHLVRGQPEAMTAALRLIAIAGWLQLLRQWMTALEAGLQRFDVQVMAEGIGTFALNAGFIVLCVRGYGIVALAGWTVLASLGTLVLHFCLLAYRTRARTAGRLRWQLGEARALFGYGWRQWVSQVAGVLFTQADRLVVNSVLGPTATGLYAAVTAVAARINELSAAPLQVIVPAIARERAKGDSGGMRHTFQNALVLNLVVAYGLAAAVMYGAQPLSELLVPSGSVATVEAMLRIAGFTYAIFSGTAASYFAAQGLGRPSINARWGVVGGTAFLVGFVVLIENFGLPAAVWANLAYALVFGATVEVQRAMGISWRWLFKAHAVFVLALGISLIASVYIAGGHGRWALSVVLAVAISHAAAAIWFVCEIRKRRSPGAARMPA